MEWQLIPVIILIAVLAMAGGLASSFSLGIERGAARVHADYAAAIKAKNGELDKLTSDLKAASDKSQTVRTEIVREFVPVETIKEVVKRIPVKTPCDLDPEAVKKLNLIR